MVYHGISWYIMVYHGISWYITLYYVISTINPTFLKGVLSNRHRRTSPAARRGEPVGEVSPQSAAAAPGHAVAEGHGAMGAMGPWISGEIHGSFLWKITIFNGKIHYFYDHFQ